MKIFCNLCDREIIENKSEYNNFVATLRKRNDECFYKQNTIIKINLDEFDKILSYYISHQNKIYIYIFFKNCEFEIEFQSKYRNKLSL